MESWSGGSRVLFVGRIGLALVALAALVALFAPGASAKGGGQIGEGFGTPGTGNGQFYNPSGFGADPVDGTLYTVDYTGPVANESSNFRIQQLSPSGTFKASTTVTRYPSAGKAVGLIGVAVDHDLGRVYMVETCRVAIAGGTLACKEASTKIGALRILVFSTTPEGSTLKALTPITLPAGANQIYDPRAIAVDPSNHDIVLLAQENAGKKIVQRISSAGVLGARYTDTAEKLKPTFNGAANSLAVGPTGIAYTLTGEVVPGSDKTRAWQLPANLSTLTEVPGFATTAQNEAWPLGLMTRVETSLGGSQLAISTDGSTLYWKEWLSVSEEKTAGNLNVRAFSLTKNETVGIWGGGSSKCKITTSTAALATTTGGNIAVFDFGAPTTTVGSTPAYGLKVLNFGPSGTGCVEPVAKFTINGKAAPENPVVNPGETVTFNAASSELAGGFRRELVWKFGDGEEKVVPQPNESTEAPTSVTHTYASAGKYTVKLEIKLVKPPYGDPAPAERTFNIGTVANFKLKVLKTGSGTGTVTSDVGGINCGVTCEAELESGKKVVLTATPDASSNFTGWSGACTGTGPCEVTMSAAKEATANFDLKQHLLKVTKSGSGAGKVAGTPGPIDCGSSCEASFNHGTEVTLTATPDASSEFKGWSGACTGGGTCKVTLSEARNVDAEFTAVSTAKFTLKVKKTGIGSAPITSSPAGIDCRGVCQADFNSGATVTLSAALNPGTKAVAWSGCDEVVGNDCKVVLDANTDVTANLDGISCSGADVTGAGSSLQGPAHTGIWGPAFEAGVCASGTTPEINYNSTGSAAGMAEWNYDGAKGSINTGLAFIGTDEAPTAAQVASIKSKAGGAELAVIPVAQTAIAVLANPPAGCSVEAITNSNLAGVIEGRITNWSKVDGVEGSCNAPITRVVRKDASGTTHQFKNYLLRLYAKGLACTTGATEGKASWTELGNTVWPESCPEKALSPVVRPASNGGSALVSTVNATTGSIGYAALPDAMAGKAGATTVLALQNNGQKKASEANFAEPAQGGVANCGGIGYQVPKLNARRDVDWSAVFGAKPAIGGSSYPLCTLTYALAFHGYQDAGFSEAQQLTVRDYLYGYVVQAAGQADITSGFYAPLPTSAEALYDVQAAAKNAAASISY